MNFEENRPITLEEIMALCEVPRFKDAVHLFYKCRKLERFHKIEELDAISIFDACINGAVEVLEYEYNKISNPLLSFIPKKE